MGVKTDHQGLGAGLACVIVAGNIFGAAIYALPATLGAVGSVGILGWAAAALGAFIVAGALSILAATTGDVDGLVGYAYRGLGPFWGFAAGLFYWMSNFVGNIAIAVALAGYATVFFPNLASPAARTVIAVLALWSAAALNLLGPRWVGRFGVVSLVAGLIPLLVIGTLGWAYFNPRLFAASWNVTGGSDAAAVRSTVVGSFFAFTGFETGAAMSAVVKDPRRNVPVATLGGVTLAALVYLSVSAVLMGLAPAHDYAVSSAPLALAMARLGGPVLAGGVALCALLKAAGTLCGLTLANAETARAGLAAYRPRGNGAGRPPASASPQTLIWSTAAATIIAAISTSPTFARQFDALLDVSALWTILPYLLCAAALVRLLALIGDPGRRRLALGIGVLAVATSAGLLVSGTVLSLALTAALAVVAVGAWRALGRRGRRIAAAAAPPASGP